MGDYFAHSKSVLFENGHVLTKGMLDESYVYPRTLMKILTNRLDECIIAGFQFDIRNNDEVFILPGCFKRQGIIYLFESEVNLQELWEHFKKRHKELMSGGDTVYLKFSAGDVHSVKLQEGVSDKVMKLEFASKFSDKDVVIGCTQFINDRIILPNSVDDFNNESCLELIDVRYGYNDEITFHPVVFRCIINKLREKEKKDNFDWLLLMLLSDTGVVKKDVLRNYVLSKGLDLNDSVDNRALLNEVKITLGMNIEYNGPSSEILHKPAIPCRGEDGGKRF